MRGVAADRFENARLAAALLREVASVDPAEYKRQQLSDAKGVSAVGVFVAELAQRMPKTTMTNISLLLPHLDGEAYSLRRRSSPCSATSCARTPPPGR